MKKILIIHHGVGVGGGLIALLGLIEELKINNKIAVLSIFDSEAVVYLRNMGVKVYLPKSKFYAKFYGLFVHSKASYFSLIDLVRNLKNMLSFFLSKVFFAKKELMNLNIDYDIVYLNSTFISDWSLAANKLGKKVIIHVREPLAKGFFGVRKRMIRNTINKYCDRVIAISKDNARRIALKDKTTVVYDPVVYKGRDASVEIVSNPKFKYFLYMGGMQRIKGFEQFVQSLKYVDKVVKIYFLGGDFAPSKSKLKRLVSLVDPYMWRINSLITCLNESDVIIKVGLVDNIFDYYNNSIALISPFSKPHASLPVLEAFCVGIPVIVADVEGMDEIVNDGNGLFFRNKDPKGLARAVNKMASFNSVHYQMMAKNAKNKFKELDRDNGSVQFVIDTI